MINNFCPIYRGSIHYGAFMTIIKSRGKADFAEGYLARNMYIPQTTERSSTGNYSDFGNFVRFEGSPRIYNLYDAGNHMWGSWMNLNNWGVVKSMRGANWNELGRDSNADQRAIMFGHFYASLFLR